MGRLPAVTTQEKGGTAGRIAAMLFSVFFFFNAIDSPVPGVSYGELILALSAAVTFFDSRGFILQAHHIHKEILIFALVCLLISLMMAPFQPVFSMTDFAVRAIRWFFYIGCAMILGKRVNPQQLCRSFFALAVLASIFLILQVVVYQLTGRAITVQIGSKTLGGTFENIYRDGNLTGKIFRFSSFFQEPAHFSYYAVLSLSLAVLYRESLVMKKRTMLGIGVILLALVCSSSTYAILLTAMLYASFVVLFIKYQGRSRSNMLGAVLLLLTGVIFLFIFHFSALWSYLLHKIASIGSTERTRFIWTESRLFPSLQKWFGVGIGNEERYYHYKTGTEIGYMNSFSLVFLYAGFAGLTLMMSFFVKSWVCFHGPSRVLLVLFAAISLYSTAFVSTTMVLYTVVIAAGEVLPVWCKGEGCENTA